MKHQNLRWNPATREWFCPACGHTSDHTNETDAHVELEQYDCNVPWVDVPAAALDNPGNR